MYEVEPTHSNYILCYFYSNVGYKFVYNDINRVMEMRIFFGRRQEVSVQMFCVTSCRKENLSRVKTDGADQM